MKEIYVKWIIEYLNNKINLKELDDKVSKSELRFIEIKEEDLDYYQKLSRPYLKYFYIRNELNLDKLVEDEKKFIENNKEKVYDLEIENFISKTIDKVILLEDTKFDKFKIAYGPLRDEYMAYNDSIVLGFRFDEKAKIDGLDDDMWLKNYLDKMLYIKKLVEEVKIIGQEKLNKEVKLIKFDEYSVTKINNE